jgi:hypothetical protein
MAPLQEEFHMRGQPWSDQELARLVRLKDQGAKWAEIKVALPGRTATAIMQAHYKIQTDRAREENRAYARAMASRPKVFAGERTNAPMPAPARVLPERGAGFVSTSRLLADAELRDRIEGRGLTAGWFGDPAPGRSALDRKRTGEPV